MTHSIFVFFCSRYIWNGFRCYISCLVAPESIRFVLFTLCTILGRVIDLFFHKKQLKINTWLENYNKRRLINANFISVEGKFLHGWRRFDMRCALKMDCPIIWHFSGHGFALEENSLHHFSSYSIQVQNSSRTRVTFPLI